MSKQVYLVMRTNEFYDDAIEHIFAFSTKEKALNHLDWIRQTAGRNDMLEEDGTAFPGSPYVRFTDEDNLIYRDQLHLPPITIDWD